MPNDIIFEDPYVNNVKYPKRKIHPKYRYVTAKVRKRQKEREKRNFLKRRAKAMAKQPTKSEIKCGEFLDIMHLRHSSQAVLFGYIPDFLLPRKVILEVDGSVHDTEDAKAHDFIKDNIFKKKGYKVVRITNDEINSKDGFDILKARLAAAGLKV